MTRTVLVLNGPNLNLLGERDPDQYGTTTLADIEAMVRGAAEPRGFAVEWRQSNHEGELVDWIQEWRLQAVGVVINPAAYTHTSVAIRDALELVRGPVIEVHLSNIHEREGFRRHSYVADVADLQIAGEGAQGYVRAIDELARLLGPAPSDG
ncbi:type II 3-dehydroquinate dehydratase [Calidifontibacter sp. DB0510]|uniref:3-dehydroquinate dehydratase n=1 Tax=Metallococcus carri TaxID=1656884 RepID=A0A967EFK5_9MICO|nr:type II 3-dehydroquinate dehydratase [Metallococcus carri]NHN56716.1 type II 3-dehydroquinate dehydratase [Metallococcus carri]NOP37907.1 type II 3-dehydroquinate dehydratase [Calidifontibacter sp. DB2511S]